MHIANMLHSGRRQWSLYLQWNHFPALLDRILDKTEEKLQAGLFS